MTQISKTILDKLSRTNFHSQYNVSVPEQIELAQLYRWLVLGFVPLPENIELQLAHLPIFSENIIERYTHQIIIDTILTKALTLLKSGLLKAQSRIKRQEKQIPNEYWQLPFMRINWLKSSTDIDLFSIRVAADAGDIKNKEIVDDYKQRHGTVSYSEIIIYTEDVIRLFDGLKITETFSLRLREQLKERASKNSKKTKKKAGAKAQYDWHAYRKHFDAIIEYYNMPGIDEPELKNQAAIESKLADWAFLNFGIAASPASIRRHVSVWLKEISLTFNK